MKIHMYEPRDPTPRGNPVEPEPIHGFSIGGAKAGEMVDVLTAGSMNLAIDTHQCRNVLGILLNAARWMKHDVPEKFIFSAGEMFYKNERVEEVRLFGFIAGEPNADGGIPFTQWSTPVLPKATFDADNKLTLAPEDQGRTYICAQGNGEALSVILDLRGNGNGSQEALEVREPPRSAVSALLEREYYPVFSNAAYHSFRTALALNRFEPAEDSPWPTARLDKGDVKGYAQLKPAAAESILTPEEEEFWVKRMWSQREELSDLDVDAMDSLSAIWLKQARSEADDAIAHIDDLLKLRHLKPKKGGRGRRGGYGPEQRAEMMSAVSRLHNVWLDIQEVVIQNRGRNKKEIVEVTQSRPIVVTDRKGQRSLDGGVDVESFLFRPGRVFSRYLLGPGRQTALLSAMALKYNPRTEAAEKRLTRYLSWQWKIRARRDGYMQPYRVSTLLREAGLTLNTRDPAKTYNRLCKALDRLEDDKIHAGWQWQDWDESTVGQRGWAAKWVEVTLLIEPPDIIRESYARLEREALSPAPTRPELEEASIGECVKAYRKQHELSQMRAANMLGMVLVQTVKSVDNQLHAPASL